mmetsp:Transcript_3699/g.7931  ORF Transcript_3699/g.7931 Transcript_3699/m.7931 type:complete len:234 (+) Transcript_3699:374-1075(+)
MGSTLGAFRARRRDSSPDGRAAKPGSRGRRLESKQCVGEKRHQHGQILLNGSWTPRQVDYERLATYTNSCARECCERFNAHRLAEKEFGDAGDLPVDNRQSRLWGHVSRCKPGPARCEHEVAQRPSAVGRFAPLTELCANVLFLISNERRGTEQQRPAGSTLGRSVNFEASFHLGSGRIAIYPGGCTVAHSEDADTHLHLHCRGRNNWSRRVRQWQLCHWLAAHVREQWARQR